MYLAHHGIKGQKWGVRRFQNPDGSYTDAGKKRYGRLPKVKKDEYAYLTRGKSNFYELKEEGLLKNGKEITRLVDDDIFFEKGSHFDRITKSEKETADRRKYVTQDIYQYTNDYFNDGSTYIKKYESIKDLKIAGYNTVKKVLKSIGKEDISRDLYMEKTEDDKQTSEILTKRLKNKGYSGLIDPVDPYTGFSNSAYIIIDNSLKEIGSISISEFDKIDYKL